MNPNKGIIAKIRGGYNIIVPKNIGKEESQL